MLLLAIFWYGVFADDDGYVQVQVFGALSIGVVDTNMGVVAKWAIVEDVIEVVIVRAWWISDGLLLSVRLH